MLAIVVASGAALAGCGLHPESALVGSWQESDWRYERLDDHDGVMGTWTDGVRLREYPDRRVTRHEAERWEFRRDGEVHIVARDGSRMRGRWRLKGRGHVMTLRFPDSHSFEVYRIQDLDEDRLILHYDVGMEARGIARLEFRRAGIAAGTEQRS